MGGLIEVLPASTIWGYDTKVTIGKLWYTKRRRWIICIIYLRPWWYLSLIRGRQQSYTTNTSTVPLIVVQKELELLPRVLYCENTAIREYDLLTNILDIQQKWGYTITKFYTMMYTAGVCIQGGVKNERDKM